MQVHIPHRSPTWEHNVPTVEPPLWDFLHVHVKSISACTPRPLPAPCSVRLRQAPNPPHVFLAAKPPNDQSRLQENEKVHWMCQLLRNRALKK